MANIKDAMSFMLINEGGYSNVEGDHGGKTNFGVTQKSLDKFNEKYPTIGLPASVKDLTVDLVRYFYNQPDYWRFDHIDDQSVATKLFDMAVNCGFRAMTRMVQGQLNALDAGVVEDGGWGPQTENSINAVEPGHMLGLLVNACVAHYMGIVSRDPSQGKFLHGWLNRAARIPHA